MKAPSEVERAMFRRLGSGARELIRGASREELEGLDEMPDLCRAEIREYLRHGAVLHLDDLFIRRLRVGMWQPALVPCLLPRLEDLIRHETGWDHRRWREEEYRLEVALESWKM